MTEKEFLSVFIPVCQYYNGKNVDKNVTELYFNTFKDYDHKIFSIALSKLIKTMKFFPKISEIIEVIEGNKMNKALVAWEYVLNNISHASKMTGYEKAPVGLQKTIERFGGWKNVGEWKMEFIDLKRKEFIELFSDEEDIPLIEDSKLKALIKEIGNDRTKKKTNLVY